MRGVHLGESPLQLRLGLVRRIVRPIRMHLSGQIMKTLLQRVGVEAKASREIQQCEVIGHWRNTWPPRSGAETFAAGTGARGVGIVHLEPAVLQLVSIVQLAAGDVEGRFWIDHHADTVALDEDVPVHRRVL